MHKFPTDPIKHLKNINSNQIMRRNSLGLKVLTAVNFNGDAEVEVQHNAAPLLFINSTTAVRQLRSYSTGMLPPATKGLTSPTKDVPYAQTLSSLRNFPLELSPRAMLSQKLTAVSQMKLHINAIYQKFIPIDEALANELKTMASCQSIHSLSLIQIIDQFSKDCKEYHQLLKAQLIEPEEKNQLRKYLLNEAARIKSVSQPDSSREVFESIMIDINRRAALARINQLLVVEDFDPVNTRLDLSWIGITRLTTEAIQKIAEFPNLVTLNLSSNNLSVLEHEIKVLASCEKLSQILLRHNMFNQLDSIANQLIDIPQLKVLDLSFNEIQDRTCLDNNTSRIKYGFEIRVESHEIVSAFISDAKRNDLSLVFVKGLKLHQDKIARLIDEQSELRFQINARNISEIEKENLCKYLLEIDVSSTKSKIENCEVAHKFVKLFLEGLWLIKEQNVKPDNLIKLKECMYFGGIYLYHVFSSAEIISNYDGFVNVIDDINTHLALLKLEKLLRAKKEFGCQTNKNNGFEINLGWIGLTRLTQRTIDALVGLGTINALDLTNNHLQDLPASLAVLNLKSLKLSLNSFKRLPDVVSKMDALKKLDVEHNSLRTLPPELKNLDDLSEIFVYGSGISEKIYDKPSLIQYLSNMYSHSKCCNDYDNSSDEESDEFFDCEEGQFNQDNLIKVVLKNHL